MLKDSTWEAVCALVSTLSLIRLCGGEPIILHTVTLPLLTLDHYSDPYDQVCDNCLLPEWNSSPLTPHVSRTTKWPHQNYIWQPQQWGTYQTAIWEGNGLPTSYRLLSLQTTYGEYEAPAESFLAHEYYSRIQQTPAVYGITVNLFCATELCGNRDFYIWSQVCQQWTCIVQGLIKHRL